MLAEDPSLWFDFHLAEKLGRTVGEIRAMPNAEYVGWQVYLQQKAEMRRAGAERARNLAMAAKKGRP